MQVNDISVLSSAQPIVDLQGPTVTLLFTIRRDVAPTLVEILGTHAAVPPAVDGPAIIINGVIDNPIGTTKVRNEFGPILGSGVRAVDTSGDPASLIRTNVVILETPHSSIGTAATRLNVDTVAVENAAGEPVYPPTTTVQRFTVAAGDAIHAGICAKDAIVTELTGGTTKSRRHAAAAGELRRALGQRPDAGSAEKAMRELISSKAGIEYGVALISATKAEPLVRRARRLVELAVQVVRLNA